jgi:hypothetical protein
VKFHSRALEEVFPASDGSAQVLWLFINVHLCETITINNYVNVGFVDEMVFVAPGTWKRGGNVR